MKTAYIVALIAVSTLAAHAQQEDGGVSVQGDGGGEEVLQSINVPTVAGAPFSLTLAAEWARPIPGGGTFTTVNSRPIKRDSQGRIYQERWLMTPKDSGIASRMSWIQIEDPVAHIYIECSARQKVCEEKWFTSPAVRGVQVTFPPSGPLPNNRGIRLHEDLGIEDVAGLPTHAYRDTTTLNPGVLGNDRPMSTVREYRFSEKLGINLRSVLEHPSLGRQTFTVTAITTSEPEPSYFQVPAGYRLLDRRTGPAPFNGIPPALLK